jgi:exonuclease III
MKLLAWNCRGLARNPAIRVLRALIRFHKPDLLFLSETMVHSACFKASLFGLGFSSWLEVPHVGSQ